MFVQPKFIYLGFIGLWFRFLDSQRKCGTNTPSSSKGRQDFCLPLLGVSNETMIWKCYSHWPLWHHVGSWGQGQYPWIPEKLSWSHDKLLLKVVLLLNVFISATKNFFVIGNCVAWDQEHATNTWFHWLSFLWDSIMVWTWNTSHSLMYLKTWSLAVVIVWWSREPLSITPHLAGVSCWGRLLKNLAVSGLPGALCFLVQAI